MSLPQFVFLRSYGKGKVYYPSLYFPKRKNNIIDEHKERSMGAMAPNLWITAFFRVMTHQQLGKFNANKGLTGRKEEQEKMYQKVFIKILYFH